METLSGWNMWDIRLGGRRGLVSQCSGRMVESLSDTIETGGDCKSEWSRAIRLRRGRSAESATPTTEPFHGEQQY